MVIKVRKAVGRPIINASKPKTTKSSTQWYHAVLPFLAGLLHLKVFYYAIQNIIPRFLPEQLLFFNTYNDTTTTMLSAQTAVNEWYHLDRAVFIAYMFDLVCCYLKVIPYSRCNSSKDIIFHHLPTLMLALPLAIPLWANIGAADPIALSLLNGNDSDIRSRFIDSFSLASGFAYISSLNDVTMCFQRAEMILAGVTTFRDIPMMKSHLFTSRGVIGFELVYKLCFFWGMSILGCKACLVLDKCIYDTIISPEDYDEPIWKTVLTLCSSPAALRGALFPAFSVVMYPSMGARCFKKIKQFLKEGKV